MTRQRIKEMESIVSIAGFVKLNKNTPIMFATNMLRVSGAAATHGAYLLCAAKKYRQSGFPLEIHKVLLLLSWA